MECIYCKKTYKCVSSLTYHQKTTKSCLLLQNKDKESFPQYKCNFCDDLHTTKSNLARHVLICKIKKDLDKKEIITKCENTEHIMEQLNVLNRNLNEEIRLKDIKIKELEEKIKKLEQKEPNSTYKKINIPKSVKTMVWNLYIGVAVSETVCMCCSQEKITMREFHCGHVISEVKGGTNSIENLRPICAPCNGSMKTMDMREFVKTYFNRELK